MAYFDETGARSPLAFGCASTKAKTTTASAGRRAAGRSLRAEPAADRPRARLRHRGRGRERLPHLLAARRAGARHPRRRLLEGRPRRPAPGRHRDDLRPPRARRRRRRSSSSVRPAPSCETACTSSPWASTKTCQRLHCADPASFLARWQAAQGCRRPAQRPHRRAGESGRRGGLGRLPGAGAKRRTSSTRGARRSPRWALPASAEAVKLVFLALVSRLLDAARSRSRLKGPSSAGKSFTVEQVLRLFPAEAFYALTAMSERALAYSRGTAAAPDARHLRGGRPLRRHGVLPHAEPAVRRPSSTTRRSRRRRTALARGASRARDRPA